MMPRVRAQEAKRSVRRERAEVGMHDTRGRPSRVCLAQCPRRNFRDDCQSMRDVAAAQYLRGGDGRLDFAWRSRSARKAPSAE